MPALSGACLHGSGVKAEPAAALRIAATQSSHVLHSQAEATQPGRHLTTFLCCPAAFTSSCAAAIAAPGDDGNYGSAATLDVLALQALSKRIHYGKFVAEAKFRCGAGWLTKHKTR